MNFQLNRNRTDKISRQVILNELTRVAQDLNFKRFSKNDFKKHGKISVSTVVREFNSWNNAIEKFNEYLKAQYQKELIESSFPANRTYSDLELYNEMERIWTIYGHRPSRNDWETSTPKISYNTYKNRFKSWTGACLNFIKYKTGELVVHDQKIIRQSPEKSIIKKHKRDINLGLRIKILSRDAFKCVLCGRSPSTHFGLILHVDHIIAIAKGGMTVENNLRTLCADCNLGKSDKEID